jgi:RNA 2'-O ribose methyltransferase substrate binding.
MNISGRNPVLEALKSNRTIDCLYIKAGDKEGSIKKNPLSCKRTENINQRG